MLLIISEACECITASDYTQASLDRANKINMGLISTAPLQVFNLSIIFKCFGDFLNARLN